MIDRRLVTQREEGITDGAQVITRRKKHNRI